MNGRLTDDMSPVLLAVIAAAIDADARMHVNQYDVQWTLAIWSWTTSMGSTAPHRCEQILSFLSCTLHHITLCFCLALAGLLFCNKPARQFASVMLSILYLQLLKSVFGSIYASKKPVKFLDHFWCHFCLFHNVILSYVKYTCVLCKISNVPTSQIYIQLTTKRVSHFAVLLQIYYEGMKLEFWKFSK